MAAIGYLLRYILRAQSMKETSYITRERNTVNGKARANVFKQFSSKSAKFKPTLLIGIVAWKNNPPLTKACHFHTHLRRTGALDCSYVLHVNPVFTQKIKRVCQRTLL